MKGSRWIHPALGLAAMMSLGGTANGLAQIVPSGLALSDQGIVFPDGTLQTTAAAGDGRPLYYLAAGSGGFDGASTLSACEAGFHFASIYEIVDPSNLRYDTSRGATTPDSGSGPPQAAEGWIRTGDLGSVQNTAGFANCSNVDGDPWQSSSGSDRGTYVWLEDPLSADWNSPASKISPWTAATAPCNIPFGVWCIED